MSLPETPRISNSDASELIPKAEVDLAFSILLQDSIGTIKRLKRRHERKRRQSADKSAQTNAPEKASSGGAYNPIYSNTMGIGEATFAAETKAPLLDYDSLTYDQLRDEIDEGKRSYAALRTKYEALERTALTANDERASLEIEIASCRMALEKQVDSNAALALSSGAEVNTLRKDLLSSRSSLARLEVEMDTLQKTHQNKTQSSNKKLSSLSTDVAIKTHNNDMLMVENQNLRRNLGTQSERVDALSSEVRLEKKKNEDLHEWSTSEKQIYSLREALRLKTDECEALSLELSEHARSSLNEVQSLKDALHDSDEKNRDLSQQITTLSAHVKVLTTKPSSPQSLRNKTPMDLMDPLQTLAVTERDRLQTEYDAQTVRAASSEALVNDLKASSEKVSAECTKAKRATADLQTKLDDMVTERGELLQAHAMAKEDQEKKLKAAVLERDRLQTEYDVQFLRAESLVGECGNRKGIVTELQKKVESLELGRESLLATHMLSLEQLEGKMKAAVQERDDLFSKYEEQTVRVKSLELSLQELETSSEIVAMEFRDAKENATILQEILEQFGSERENLSSSHRESLVMLEKQVAALSGQQCVYSDHLRQENRILKDRLDDMILRLALEKRGTGTTSNGFLS